MEEFLGFITFKKFIKKDGLKDGIKDRDECHSNGNAKILKQLGVTAHQELADALAKAVADGKLRPGASVPVTARIEVADLAFTHDVTANLVAPE